MTIDETLAPPVKNKGDAVIEDSFPSPSGKDFAYKKFRERGEGSPPIDAKDIKRIENFRVRPVYKDVEYASLKELYVDVKPPISYQKFFIRVCNGMSVEEAINIPERDRKKKK